MAFDASVNAKAIDLIKLAIDMTTAAGSGHPTSAASLAHLVTVLMYEHMRYDPRNPAQPAADRLVLSEGHSCPIIYAAAADLGILLRDGSKWRPMTRADAMRLREIDSPIDGHPNPAEGFPFFPAATGSLGQGLSIAAGLALAARLDGIKNRIFCLMGDGESREGQIWETVDFLADYHLNAVCPIFNCNGYGQSDHVSPQQAPEVTAGKLRGAGYDVRLIDGHDPSAIRKVLEEHAARSQDPQARPFAIVARTVKAWGFTSVVGDNFHGKPVPEKEKDRAFAALDAMGRQVGAAWTEGDLKISPFPGASRSPEKGNRRPPSFLEALKQFGKEKLLESGKLAPRKAYGVALQALGHANARVVALDADVKNSTYSEFFAKDPQLAQRFFECRIAEQNMLSCAGGLASGGKLPFVSTFGKFMMRAYDQLELGLISRFALKVVGSHVGLGPCSDGPSQMALPDVAYFHAWTTVKKPDGRPALYLLNPADAFAAYHLTLAMAEYEGACYLRTMRPDVPILYDDKTPFALGGHQVLARGKDLLIIATGYMVHEAKKALSKFGEQGMTATLVDLYSLPFDASEIISLAEEHDGRVLTLEDNYGAGFGAAVAEALTAHGGTFKVKQMFVSRIPKSGRTLDDELRFVGLSPEDITRAVTELCEAAPVGAGK